MCTRIETIARTERNQNQGTGENARTKRRRIKAHHKGEEQGGEKGVFGKDVHRFNGDIDLKSGAQVGVFDLREQASSGV